LLEYFKQATSITAEPPIRENKTIVEVIEDIWKNRDRDYNVRCLVKRLQRIDKEMSGEGRELFSVHIPNGDLREYAADLPQSLKENFTDAMALLRDKAFQDLLMNYPRPSRVFLVAHETVDTVSSSWVVRGADGKDYRPEDYLVAFSRFVRENPEKVEAIRILLNRPRGWSTEALMELRRKLAVSPQRFTEENLRKVHEVCYHKALVDIISMVKHAANDQNLLMTAEERVSSAFDKVTGGKTFTTEQQQWLGMIEAHLIENLTIDRQDFDTLPVFARQGGLSQATRIFGPRLDEMIIALNEAIAA
jgi:type I restriction enzyme R subunit